MLILVNLCQKTMRFLSIMCVICLLLLVLLISYNVIARYAFQASSIAIEELSWHIYAALFLFSIPVAFRSQSHVRVDVFFEHFSDKTKAWVDIIGCLIFLIPTCGIIIWGGWHFTLAAYDIGVQPDSVRAWFFQLIYQGIGERSQDVGGLLNRWIIKGAIPLSFTFLLLATVTHTIEKLHFLLSQKSG